VLAHPEGIAFPYEKPLQPLGRHVDDDVLRIPCRSRFTICRLVVSHFCTSRSTSMN
jgi:hypothetical protein